ncbi:hypothetical protein LLB_3443 [Legionella longbeachae D-4968]|nr:hypothetical protein LLB_3443 [Legionella longbeachae D-4968]
MLLENIFLQKSLSMSGAQKQKRYNKARDYTVRGRWSLPVFVPICGND